MRVFLTGASGYLGSVLAEHLAQEAEIESITGIDIAPPKNTLPPKVSFVEMDTRSPDLEKAMAGHDVVVHTAFIVQWLAKMSAAERDDINLSGARNVAQAAIANKVKRFVHASSVAAYDTEAVQGKENVDEAFPVGKGNSFFYYANGKAMAERTLNKVLGSSHAIFTALRPYYIMGPHNTATVEYLRASAASYRDGNPRLQYVHEDDVASAFVQAVKTDLPGAYNVAPDDWFRWNDTVRIIDKDPSKAIPSWLARMVLGFTWRFLGASSHPSWVRCLFADFVVSNAKLRATGWSPQYSCEEALRAAL